MTEELTLLAVGDIEVRPTGRVPESLGWDADEQFDLVLTGLQSDDQGAAQTGVPGGCVETNVISCPSIR